jgi:CBS domain-containing protein
LTWVKANDAKPRHSCHEIASRRAQAQLYEGKESMNAHDVMTSAVISVNPGMSEHDVAKVLNDHHISAVPVVDEAGAAIGMISEGDLIARDDASRQARQDWWLALLAEGEALHPNFIANLRAREHTARDLMISPVVTISEQAELSEIARLLTEYRIKRVPVVRDGRVVGIVSRADLIRALATESETKPAEAESGSRFAAALAGIDSRFLHLQRRRRRERAKASLDRAEPDDTELTVADFRDFVTDHDHKQAEEQQEHRHALAEQRRHHVAELIDQHVSDASWRALIHRAREAAEHGDREFMLLRFPSPLCSDGGRAINALRPEWPETLRGEAAELFLRWERDLKPHGFRLVARVLDFPDGMPGDIGLYLSWGQ